MPGPLGRRPPSDWTHVDKYPLMASMVPAKPTPVVIGVNWYVEFDKPEKDDQGHFWIARDAKLTTVRGGHCVCLKPKGDSDPDAWWDFYNQGSEGACVGFGISRLDLTAQPQALRRLLALPRGAEGRRVAGGGLRRHVGARRPRHPAQARPLRGRQRQDEPEAIGEGIKANRWARSVDDVLTTLGYGGLDYVDVLNSWGRGYPHLTRMPATVLERLWKEDGEVGLVTDR